MIRRTALPSSLLVALLAALLGACGPSDAGSGAGDSSPDAAAPRGPRTVVLVSLDTVRPGRLGVYGGQPDVSPVIDAFAADSVVFDQALAPSPWTLPSHMTMLTGLDPVAHGVINDSTGLSGEVTTLAEALSAAGFVTGAFTDGGFVSGRYGFDQGFDVYDDQRDDTPGAVNGFPRVMPLALRWLEQKQDDDLFLFVHTFDAHTPYDETAPEILERFRARRVEDGPLDYRLHWARSLYKQVKVGVTNYPRMGNLLNDYDAGVFEADHWLRELFDELRAQGRYDDALIVVTSDHGESFFDHGLHVGHGLALTDDEVHIPLLMHLPGGEGAGQRHGELVSLVDLARTVLDVQGLPAHDALQGESLLGLVRGRQRRVDFVLGYSQNTRAWSLVKNGFKYITPVGVKPMIIAERHLGAFTPEGVEPMGEEDCYTIDTDNVSLCYDVVGDPLAMLDVLPASEELFDRAADPEERHDLTRTLDLLRLLREKHSDGQGRAPTDEQLAGFLTDAGEQELLEQAFEIRDLLGRMRQAYVAESGRSSALAARFQTEEVYLDPAEQRVLASLGYLESGNREDLKGVSRQMQEWVLHPIRAPNTAALTSADIAVHRVRVRLAEGGALSANDARVLFGAGDACLDWAAEHPEYASRVRWRLVELNTLTAGTGLALPVLAWSERLAEIAPGSPR